MPENRTAPTSTVIDERLAAWSKAELDGDATTLDALVHPAFAGVGPYGFVLDREQWLARFGNSIVLVGAQASIAHMQLSLGSPPEMPS
jgi:hypothetical protein